MGYNWPIIGLHVDLESLTEDQVCCDSSAIVDVKALYESYKGHQGAAHGFNKFIYAHFVIHHFLVAASYSLVQC